MAQKTSLICVIDVGAHMSSKIGIVQSLLSSFVLQKMMTSKTFEMAIVTYGSSVTSNHLNDKDADQYVGINEVCQLGVLSMTTLTSIRSLTHSQESGDIIDGVAVGYSILANIGKKKCNRLMLIITNGESEIEGIEDLEAMVNAMVLDNDDIKYSSEEERIKNCVVSVGYVGNPESRDASIIVKENSKMLKQVSLLTGGVYMEGNTFEDLLPVMECKGMGTRPIQYKIILELAPSVRIKCIHWTKISVTRFPSLKKESTSYDGLSADTGAIKRDTTYTVPSLDGIEATYEEKVKGYRYGTSYVPVADAESLFEIKGEMGVKLIGFMPAIKIKRHHFLDATVVIQGAPDHLSSQSALVSLSRAMLSTVNVAVARLVKKENADVVMVVLIPSGEDGVLHMHRVPCTEDMRDLPFGSLTSRPVSSPQRLAVSNLVNMMTIPGEQPPLYQNSALLNFYLDVERRATSADQALHRSEGYSSAAELNRSVDAIRVLKSTFPLVETQDAHPMRQKKYWSDIVIAAASADSEGAIGAGMETEDQKVGLNLGSVDPVADLGLLVAAQGPHDALSRSVSALEEIVHSLVCIGSTKAHYRKAVACLKAYRDTAVLALESSRFNGYLAEIKRGFSHGEHEGMWLELQAAGITLIHSAEVSDSVETIDSSNEFLLLVGDSRGVHQPTQVEAPRLNDDMFDDME